MGFRKTTITIKIGVVLGHSQRNLPQPDTPLTYKQNRLSFRVALHAYVEYSSLAIKDQNLGSTMELVSSLVYTPPDD